MDAGQLGGEVRRKDEESLRGRSECAPAIWEVENRRIMI
jgi:hypothetical protein